MNWRPMMSAPRDGQRFVAGLWVGQNVGRAGSMRFEMHIIRADDRGRHVHPDDDHGWSWDDYTHWMALPDPPLLSPKNEGACDPKLQKPSRIRRDSDYR